MTRHWQVVVIGIGWEYRAVVRLFFTRFGAERYAHQMRSMPGVIPLTYSVERTP